MKQDIITNAVATLSSGGTIAYPTEAVYGLGCDPLNINAVLKLIALKKRDPKKGLILVAANLEQLRPYLACQTLTPAMWQQLQNLWPGPYTFVIPASSLASDLITGGLGSIAVRVSAHPVIQALCIAFGRPIVSTSCNVSGRAPMRTYAQVAEEFQDRVDLIIDEHVGSQASPTEIINIVTGQIIRH